MRVYVVSAVDDDFGLEEVLEVFVNEQDAKKYKADNLAENNDHYGYRIDPRELRTAWRG